MCMLRTVPRHPACSTVRCEQFIFLAMLVKLPVILVEGARTSTPGHSYGVVSTYVRTYCRYPVQTALILSIVYVCVVRTPRR